MTSRLHIEIQKLQEQLIQMSKVVDDNFSLALKALDGKDIALAQKVIDSDDALDQIEIHVEEECLKILALYHPVANDLRFIITILKINNDLERIGDMICNIGNETIRIAHCSKELPLLYDLGYMAEIVKTNFKESLDALVINDEKRAALVWGRDREINAMHKNVIKLAVQKMKDDPANADFYLASMSISKQLERIGDHVCAIAQDVLYWLQGSIVRHKPSVIQHIIGEK